MDDRWIERLIDSKPEGSFFGDYARLLRFVSGLNASGLLRLVTAAEVNRKKEAELTRLRADPNVAGFLRFLESVPPADLPVIIAVISDGLYEKGILKDRRARWFDTNSFDPRSCPSVAIERMVRESRYVSGQMAPLVVPMSDSVVPNWEAVPFDRNSVVSAAFDVQVDMSIFLQLLADEVVLTKRQMHMPVNGTGRGLIEAVQHGFQDILTGLKCSLVLLDGTVIDDLDKELRLLTPPPPFVSFRVSLDELVVKHGVQRLAEVFHEVEVFREAALSSTGDAGENIPHFEVLEVVVKADTSVLCECRFHVPNDGSAKLLCESVQEHFGSVLKEIESYGLFAMSGERVPEDCVLLRQMPGVKAFVFQIPLKKLRERFTSEELLKVFPEAECFGPSPIDNKQMDKAENEVVTDQGSAGRVPDSSLVEHQAESNFSVLKIYVICDSTVLMTRYERVTNESTGRTLVDRIRELLPESHKHLGILIRIGASGLILDPQVSLLMSLRPTEYVLELHLVVDKLDKTQTKQAIAVLKSALAVHDAHPPEGCDEEFEQVRVEEATQRPCGSMRPVTPPRGPRKKYPIRKPPVPVPRPTFGSHSGVSRQSVDDAMASSESHPTAASKKAARPTDSEVIEYEAMPALTDTQNSKLEEFAEHLRGLLRKHKTKFGSYVFEMDGKDPLMVSNPQLDRALRYFAVKWKLPLPSLGTYWNMSRRQEPEISVVNEATIFINIDLMNKESPVDPRDETRKRSRSRHRDRSRRKQHKRSRSHGRDTKDGEKLNEVGNDSQISHGTGKSHGCDGDRCQNCSPTLQWTQSEIAESGQKPLDADHLQTLCDHSRVLSEMLKSAVAFGSTRGCFLKAHPLIVQKICNGSCDHGVPWVPGFLCRVF